ncbi:MAG: ATP-binding cassette domain-containing protein [Culicoidibacterales bacterium]
MAVITVENLVKSYKKRRVVDNFNLVVEEKEVIGLLGPNGSGKSTIINCIVSLLRHDSGTIKIFDKEMKRNQYDIKKDIGLVMQDVGVIEELTVKENIEYFCGLYINNKPKLKKYVQDAIDFVELNEFKNYTPKKLSGGLLRRLNLACGIAHKPKLIFFDEPTVAVDPQSRNKILEQIKKLNEQGATIIYTSHYMEEVEYLCSRIIIMDSGRILTSGTGDELREKYSTSEIISFELLAKDTKIVELFQAEKDVISCKYSEGNLELKMVKNEKNLMNILTLLKTHNLSFSKMQTKQPTLNDVFLEITGKELRD